MSEKGTPMSSVTSSPTSTPTLGSGSENVKTTVKCKLVLVGDCACGKTSLIKKYLSGEFVEAYTPSEFDTYTSTYNVTDSYTIQLSLWDTSGKDEYSRVRPLSYTDADIILLCYSIGIPVSLDHIQTKWYPEIREKCPNQPVILVGCQKDLREHKPNTKKTEQNVSTYDQGLKMAKIIDAVMFSEVSAKTSRKSIIDIIEVAAMSSAGCKVEKKSATFRRRRNSFQRKRFSEIGETKRVLRDEAAKSCKIM